MSQDDPDLPAGWMKSTIGERCQVVSGATPKTGEAANWGAEINWLTPDDLSKNRSKVVSSGARALTQTGYDSCSASLVPPGTVLFSSRAPIGYVAIAGGEVCTNQGFKSAIPDDSLTSEFLYWQLQHVTPDIRSRASGTTFLEISKKGFAATEIAIPPLEEQARIVEVLEEHLSRLDAALASIRTVRYKATQCRRSLLHAAFSDEGERMVTLGDVALLENGDRGRNYPSKQTLVESGIPFVNAGHLASGRVTSDGLSYITEEHMQRLAQGKFRAGDILFCLRGSLGKCALVDSPMVGAIASSLVIVRPGSDVLGTYLFRFLTSPQAERQITLYNNGTAQPNLAARDLRRFEMVLPPLEEQGRRIAALEAQLSRLDATIAAVDQVEARCAALRRSLLHAAFGGKLTEEWREAAHV